MNLSNKRIAILANDGFEQSELLEPLNRLKESGATVEVVSPSEGSIRGWNRDDWGESVPVDRAVTAANVDDFDALILPGGQINPDLLRTDQSAVDFVRRFAESGKPVAAICHAPWLLIEADLLRGRRVTSYHSIRTDVRNAGGNWVDAEVVVDENLVTSRSPDDLPAFIRQVTKMLAGAG